MVGKAYLSTALTGTATETVFLVMMNELFTPFCAGLVLSAVLAAIMSTASSQLLVAASAFAQDFYHSLIHKEASQHELVWVSRISVLSIAAIAILMGLNPDNLILNMVAYAWAGFGATFGPALLASLFWRRATRNGILAGIIVGGVTVLVWKQFAFFGLYEIIPGFFFALLAIYIVSKLDKNPEASVTQLFDEVGKTDAKNDLKTPSEKFEDMVKAKQAETGDSYHKAYATISKTAEGRALLKEINKK